MAEKGAVQTEFERLTVASCVQREVWFGHPETRAEELARWMLEGFGSVPIVDDDQRLVGIVSEFDLLAALEHGRRWRELTARGIMSPNPYAAREGTELGTLIHVLRTSNLIRVPVVDAEGRLIGIIARRDIIRKYLEAQAE